MKEFVEYWLKRAEQGVDGVVFDFGGVIVESAMENEALYRFCESKGMSREMFRQTWQAYRKFWDGGFCTFEELYDRQFADVGVKLAKEDYATLWELDTGGWMAKLRPETLELMRRLKANGKKIGILSNMAKEFFERAFKSVCAEYRAEAEVEVISAYVHLYKPQREIYDLAERLMGIPAARLLFLDDLECNVNAAREYGWQSEVYPPIDQLEVK